MVDLTSKEIEVLIEWHEYDATSAEAVGAVEVEKYHDERVVELQKELKNKNRMASTTRVGLCHQCANAIRDHNALFLVGCTLQPGKTSLLSINCPLVKPR